MRVQRTRVRRRTAIAQPWASGPPSASSRLVPHMATPSRGAVPRKDGGWRPVAPGDAAWMRDDAGMACPACGRMFTLLRRRHHCRRCGTLACGACAPAAPPSNHRVCRAPCAAAHPLVAPRTADAVAAAASIGAETITPAPASPCSAAPAPTRVDSVAERAPPGPRREQYTLPDAYTSLPLGAAPASFGPPVLARRDLQLERELGRG